MLLALVATALGAPVLCSPEAAFGLLTEARIEEERAPISHPELVPGLARASEHASPALRRSLADLCREGGTLSVVGADSWRDQGWSAYALYLTRTERQGCLLEAMTLPVSVGIDDGRATYDLLREGAGSASATPLGDCDEAPAWMEERVLSGQNGPVRLVLQSMHEGEEIASSRVLVRWATGLGWREQVLVQPAPPRLLDPDAGGPRMVMTDVGEHWIVMSGDREITSEGCQARAGQQLWRLRGDHWEDVTGEEALRALASRGLWRLAGDDGWLAIVTQDEEEDEALVEARARRLGELNQQEVMVVRSSWFPMLNPAFSVAMLGPFPTEAEARASLKGFRGGARRYTKQAWRAPSTCPFDPSLLPRVGRSRAIEGEEAADDP